MIPALISVGATLFVGIVGLVFQAGMLREQLAGLRTELNTHRQESKARHDELRDEFRRSAKDQGRRVGNLESCVGLTADGIPVERMGGFSGRVRTPEGENDR